MMCSYFIQANSPIRTLDELTVTEVFPALYFPSIVERSEVKSSDGALVLTKASELKSSSECSNSSEMNVGKCGAENGQIFGHRSKHRCYVITARARSFLYHQVNG